MPVNRPYYALHQIVTGQYTSGNEFVLADGSDYIGGYHILPNEQVFTGAQPQITSNELYVKRTDQTEDVKQYNILTNSKTSQYVSPIPIFRIPDSDEYREGIMERYFVQKRNNPLNTIMEIDADQYNSINRDNVEGINGVMYNDLLIDWRISNIPRGDAQYHNQQTLITSEKTFRGITSFLTNPLEFYK